MTTKQAAAPRRNPAMPPVPAETVAVVPAAPPPAPAPIQVGGMSPFKEGTFTEPGIRPSAPLTAFDKPPEPAAAPPPPAAAAPPPPSRISAPIPAATPAGPEHYNGRMPIVGDRVWYWEPFDVLSGSPSGKLRERPADLVEMSKDGRTWRLNVIRPGMIAKRVDVHFSATPKANCWGWRTTTAP